METVKQDVVALLTTFATTWGLTLIGAVTLALAGVWLAGWGSRAIVRLGARSPRMDRTLVPLLAKLVKGSILVITTIAVLDLFGIQTASILAFLGAAGIAVGLALKDTVADLAAGVVLLVLRPFDVNDAVDIGGTAGVVRAIDLFETKMVTFDGVPQVLPNSKVRSGLIRNFSRAEARRLDLTIGISYGDDIEKAVEALRGVVAADGRVQAEPAPLVTVGSLGDSSVNLLVRVWTAPGDLFNVQCDLTRAAKEKLDAVGISIPFPQRDVHLHEAKPKAA